MSEGKSLPDTAGDDRARELLERRQQALCKYLEASGDVAGSRIRANLTGWRRWLHRLPGTTIANASGRRDALLRELARHGVGAEDRRWGVLSGGYLRSRGAPIGLEFTLAELMSEYESTDPHWARQLRVLADAAERVRPLAALGDRVAVGDLTEQVVAVTRAAPDEAARQRLSDHLPGALRPLPADLESLRRGDDLVDVAFDVYANTIKLDNITVNPELRGTGLGTAVLQQLCRAADAHHLTIVGQLVPTYRDDDSAVPLLAAWCRKHGFAVNERLGGRISRTPASIS
ncbi:GNAT family N-acetyltransferase [Nocardia acidivorans]|uniref:GNAT family N-acetyltransferase n=1 Tax=Nocardia acidivorans TaxID=404580 RepID=UPI000835C0A5|nr:GNAT family N-acetyltransferase [Nocardia acidivorans]